MTAVWVFIVLVHGKIAFSQTFVTELGCNETVAFDYEHGFVRPTKGEVAYCERIVVLP